MKGNPYPKRDNAGEIVGWVLIIGKIELLFGTKEEALAAWELLLLEENKELLDFFEKRIFENVEDWEQEDILKALEKQNEIFKKMILVLFGARVWGSGMAEQLIWQAIDFCVGLTQAIQPPAPAPRPTTASNAVPRG